MLVQDLAKVENDPSVRAVVLAANSPGGHTTMIHEASQIIKAFPKPIETYVVGQAASAMYFLASASDKITLDRMAMVGSIGVVGAFSKDDGNTIEIVSSNAPDKRPDLNTEAGRGIIQNIMNDMETVFIDTVAKNRNMTKEQVTSLRGGVAVGDRAVALGFADAVGSLESVILRLQQETNPMDLNTLKAEHEGVYKAAFQEGVQSVSVVEAVNAERHEWPVF
jgi:ClpP class serine protease